MFLMVPFITCVCFLRIMNQLSVNSANIWSIDFQSAHEINAYFENYIILSPTYYLTVSEENSSFIIFK